MSEGVKIESNTPSKSRCCWDSMSEYRKGNCAQACSDSLNSMSHGDGYSRTVTILSSWPAEEASAGQDAKDRGNAAFKAGDFAGAIAAYSEAIQADRRNPVYYSNRAMAALKVPSVLLRYISASLIMSWHACDRHRLIHG